MTRNVIEILADCPIFSEVSEAGFQRLAVMARICNFPKSYRIFNEGEDCAGVYVVDQGLVRIFRTGAGGKEHVLHMVGPGSTFAEVAAIGGFKYPANAETIESTTCLLLPLQPLRKAIEDDHELCLCMMSGLSCWVQDLVGLMGSVVLRDSSGRVARYLLEMATDGQDAIELPALKRHIANHLNLTSETFSRVLRRFIKDGLISDTSNSNLIQLLDRQKLKQIAKGDD
jgi:CRP/FNR family transcriptional regulator, dissimilatory nitrate respiration regulator